MQLISIKNLKDYQVVGENQNLGEVDGFHFDTDSWEIRYLRVKRGFWIFKKETLMPIEKLAGMFKASKVIKANVKKSELDQLPPATTEQVKNTQNLSDPTANQIPTVATHTPSGMNPAGVMPIVPKIKGEPEKPKAGEIEAIQFRTLDELIGYKVEAKDGQVGEAVDFILNTDNWQVSYIIVKGSQKKLMLPPEWVKNIQPIYEKIQLNLNKKIVLTSPYALG